MHACTSRSVRCWLILVRIRSPRHLSHMNLKQGAGMASQDLALCIHTGNHPYSQDRPANWQYSSQEAHTHVGLGSCASIYLGCEINFIYQQQLFCPYPPGISSQPTAISMLPKPEGNGLSAQRGTNKSRDATYVVCLFSTAQLLTAVCLKALVTLSQGVGSW